ncbi:MAG: lysophospholipid acyltransferase [Micromonosporaceae bacterium]
MDPGALRNHPALVAALDRVGARRLLQRTGVVDEPYAPLGSDTLEVTQLLTAEWFTTGLDELAQRDGADPAEVRAEAAAALREMAASHGRTATDTWRRFEQWLLRAYDVFVDDEAVARLRKLDRKHALLFLFSHRSYLDGAVLPEVLHSRGLSPLYTFGGANLNFFPVGSVASRTGVIFIRRDTKGRPVYRWSLRAYIGQLLRRRANLAWSIEGGRTRTGKLRPPVYGILRYVIDAVEAVEGPEVLVVPVSVVYDQLHEVAMMTTEAKGGSKRQEGMRWLVKFAREQRTRLGRAYLDVGEPVPLRERLAELRADPDAAPQAVERIALDLCHRINRITPVTATAVVSLALLGADRALTLDQVLATVRPLADYITARGWPVAGAADLTNRATIRRALQEMVASGVLSCYDGGTETVWAIVGERHLIAAFYRNTAIHILVDRAIGELALVAATESAEAGNVRELVWQEALRLRELFKFEFFFAGRGEFSESMLAELALIDPDGRRKAEQFTAGDARTWLDKADPYLAHLVLRPFLDAYHVVADRLVAWQDEYDEPALLAECLRVGKQWELQRRIASAESVSLELFKTALRLAGHRDLLDSTAPHLDKRRQEFLDEIRATCRAMNVIAELARPGGELTRPGGELGRPGGATP